MRPFVGLGIVFIHILSDPYMFSSSSSSLIFLILIYFVGFYIYSGRFVFLFWVSTLWFFDTLNCSLWCFCMNHANADNSVIDPFSIHLTEGIISILFCWILSWSFFWICVFCYYVFLVRKYLYYFFFLKIYVSNASSLLLWFLINFKTLC